jgi:AraC family transcriptional regulator
MLLRTPSDSAFGTSELHLRDDPRGGRETCVVLRRTRRAELGLCAHTLSIRAVWDGTEVCHVGGRDIGIDDDNFLVLNHGRIYSTSIRALHPVESLSIWFRPGLAESACAAMAVSLQQALSDGDTIVGVEPQFSENLQPHDSCVTPVLQFIRRNALQGVDDEAWYEEQLHFLLERMQRHRQRLLAQVDELRLGRATTRREVFRRIGYATDFIHTNYARAIDLDQMARVACLSKYHFLRLFALVHGVTPFSYLQRKRARVALRLLRTTAYTVADVACSVGFAERTTLLRQIQRWTGLRLLQIRAGNLANLKGASHA